MYFLHHLLLFLFFFFFSFFFYFGGFLFWNIHTSWCIIFFWVWFSKPISSFNGWREEKNWEIDHSFAPLLYCFVSVIVHLSKRISLYSSRKSWRCNLFQTEKEQESRLCTLFLIFSFHDTIQASPILIHFIHESHKSQPMTQKKKRAPIITIETTLLSKVFSHKNKPHVQ